MKKFAWRTIQISLLILTVLGIVKAVFVSLDIDESYAVAAAYRLVCGDKLLYDMWEPHQLSAFLPALFLFPYVKLSGTTAYCVIFLRIVGIIIHILIGQYLYHVTKEEAGKKSAFLITILHLNFLPKWVSMPEFELMHYWGAILIFLLLYRHEKTGKNLYSLFAGLAYTVTVLCYPSLIILFPLYLIVIKKGRYPIKGPLLFTLGAGIPACFTGGWILSYMMPSQIREFAGYILMDASHTGENASFKWIRYFWEVLDQLKIVAIAFAIAIGLTLVLTLILKFAGKAKLRFKEIAVIAVSLCIVVLSIETLYGYLLDDKNQFYLQVRFVIPVIAFFVFSVANYREYKMEFLYGILPVTVSLPLIFMITNMDTNTAYAKLMPAVVIGLFIIMKYFRQNREEKNLFNIVAKYCVNGAAAGLLICFFICKILLIRVSGCLPVTVKAPMVQIKCGPAAGIFVLDELGNAWNEEYDVIRNFVGNRKNALYIGAEQLFYVAFCENVSTPSVQGTAVYNEMYAKYYEVFPEKMPQIIVIDETFQDTPGYFYYPQNEYIFEWIEKEFRKTGEIEIGPYHVIWSD